jgi:ssRNA-specific RNase YbeY (16S rRNA maturation enzyme)
MIKIHIFNPNNYDIDESLIKNSVLKIFKQNKIPQNTETSIAIVDENKMEYFSKLYLNEVGYKAKSHPVLSFLKSEIESEFIFPPDNINHIGEIIINYNKAKTSRKMAALAEHAALHLCGIHHK